MAILAKTRNDMRKTIRGNPITLQLDVTNEYFHEYLELFKKYFRQGAHHHCVQHSINKDAILIYSFFPSALDCHKCGQMPEVFSIPKINIDMNDAAFFEDRFRDIPCSRVHEIKYDSRRIGYYCKKNNIFCTTDIAHHSGNGEHLQAIFNAMEERGYLSPISKKEKIAISLGTDPEMESLIDGEIVPGNTLPQMMTGEKIYISSDGARNQREIRPDPSTIPEELVENIRDLIKVSSFFGEDLSVLGKRFPLGGHIHIGGASPSSEVISALDYFLSPFNEFSSDERKRSKYGKKGDFRFQPHGFEYRTPPPAWLLTPKLALMTLYLTKSVVETLINGTDIEIDDDSALPIYRENLKQFGFSDAWIDDFLHEIEWAKANMHEPLAKLWGVDIPKEFKASKQYRFKPGPMYSTRSHVTSSRFVSLPDELSTHDPEPEYDQELDSNGDPL